MKTKGRERNEQSKEQHSERPAKYRGCCTLPKTPTDVFINLYRLWNENQSKKVLAKVLRSINIDNFDFEALDNFVDLDSKIKKKI